MTQHFMANGFAHEDLAGAGFDFEATQPPVTPTEAAKPAVNPAPAATAATPPAKPAAPTVIPTVKASKKVGKKGEILALDALLQSILETRRAHNSMGELSFLQALRDRLKPHTVQTKAEGCLAVTIGPKNHVMFSCHIDTMHSSVECTGTKQTLVYDPAMGHVFTSDGGCLGADDGAGIYIMLRMIDAKVQGTYVFHRGEERGCIGSRAMLLKDKDWLSTFTMCVAFDRPYDYEVIVTQGGTPCASLTCGEAIVRELGKHNLSYEVSHKGVITDSKVYNGIIKECLNLGVGYEQQHSNKEYLNVEHLMALTEAAIKIDWSKLPIARNLPTPTAHNFDGYKPPYVGYTQPKTKKGGGAKVSNMFRPSLVELEEMDYEELLAALDEGDSTSMATAIMRLMADLDSERGRVSRLQKLLGL